MIEYLVGDILCVFFSWCDTTMSMWNVLNKLIVEPSKHQSFLSLPLFSYHLIFLSTTFSILWLHLPPSSFFLSFYFPLHRFIFFCITPPSLLLLFLSFYRSIFISSASYFFLSLCFPLYRFIFFLSRHLPLYYFIFCPIASSFFLHLSITLFSFLLPNLFSTTTFSFLWRYFCM